MKFLLIQTAFIGDVILATPLIEKLHRFFPDAQIDVVVRKGNETLLKDHPHINSVYIWDKNKRKYSNLLHLIKQIRTERYDHVINMQRFAASGLLTILGGGKETTGFRKNPFSFMMSHAIEHDTTQHIHETARNLKLIEHITDAGFELPRLYPSAQDYKNTLIYKKRDYVCIAPASVWFTKQLPKEKWLELIRTLQSNSDAAIYLLGSSSDAGLCGSILKEAGTTNISVLAGKLSLLETAALMQDAQMNYVNDSAPLHIASAMNAPVTAFFCSTIPAFGFRPLSQNSTVVETEVKLSCRPCGLHGYRKCPLGHFRCAYTISINSLPVSAGQQGKSVE